MLFWWKIPGWKLQPRFQPSILLRFQLPRTAPGWKSRQGETKESPNGYRPNITILMELLARVTIVHNQPLVVHNPNGTARPWGVVLDRDNGDLYFFKLYHCCKSRSYTCTGQSCGQQ